MRPAGCLLFCRKSVVIPMPHPFVGILTIALAFQCCAADFTGRVVSIHDGDTITVQVDDQQVKVRVADIDAPELGQAFGRSSRGSLAQICANSVAVVGDRGRDRYGRTIGRVSCAGRDAAGHQVGTGMAWVFDRYAKSDSPLYPIQDVARRARSGLWVELAPVPPWDWRKR